MSGDARLFTSSLHHSLPSMLRVGPIAVWGLPVSHGVTLWKLCSSCRCRGLYSSRFRSRDSFHNSVVCNPVIKLLSLLVIICFRWVDDELDVHEDFIGLYETESTEAIALLTFIHDVLNRLNISITKLRGQCYDGASAMSGCKAGVAKLILDEEPREPSTHTVMATL